MAPLTKVVVWLAFIVFPSSLGVVFAVMIAWGDGVPVGPFLARGEVLVVLTALNAASMVDCYSRLGERAAALLLCAHFSLTLFTALFYVYASAVADVGKHSGDRIVTASLVLGGLTIVFGALTAARSSLLDDLQDVRRRRASRDASDDAHGEAGPR